MRNEFNDGVGIPRQNIRATKFFWPAALACLAFVCCATAEVAPPPKTMTSSPGQTSLRQADLPAGVYEVTFRAKIDRREDTVTPLAKLTVHVPGYPNVIFKAITPINFDAANASQEFTFQFDNFKTQEVQAAVNVIPNQPPVPQLSVEQIRVAPSPRVSIGTVWPGKILYYTDEAATGVVAVYNGAATPQTVTLRCALESDLDSVRSLKDEPLTLQPGERREVSLTWNTGKEEYGFALAATLVDAAGKQLDLRREYFSVADNLWKVCLTPRGRGCEVPSGPGPNAGIPVSQVKEHENQLAAELAKPFAPVYWNYANYNEFYAWSPDHYFVQAPEPDYWYSGIGNYTMGKRWLQMAVEWLHRRGMRATSYVLPWSGGYGGDKVYQKHPDWFVYEKSGSLTWSGYQKKLEVGSAVGGTENPFRLRLAPYASCLCPNIANRDTIDAFIDQVVKSQKMFGFDGIRFDTAIFSAVGYDLSGRKIDNDDPKTKDKLEVRAWQRMRDSLWEKLGPNFVIGNNEDYELYINRNGAAWEESCRKGCLLMEEVPRSSHSPQSARNRWQDYMTYYHGVGEIVRGLGGHHLIIGLDTQYPVDHLYMNVFTYAMRAHPFSYQYHPDDLPLGNYAQFITRYSALMWD
ncbi:MAG: hypothetical protein PHR35_18055, partial [Kiritimatiellae bacterium]|nr:hypothetical protein [Kiritimatiellia bacterium]